MDPRALRTVAVTAAAASALLYYLIGFGALDIGTSTTSEAPDLLAFGLVVGTTYALIGLVIAIYWSRWLLAFIGLLDAAVIIGYFAMASIRVPPFEPWGLLIKALQVVLLVAIGILLFAHPMERLRVRHRHGAHTVNPALRGRGPHPAPIRDRVLGGSSEPGKTDEPRRDVR